MIPDAFQLVFLPSEYDWNNLNMLKSENKKLLFCWYLSLKIYETFEIMKDFRDIGVGCHSLFDGQKKLFKNRNQKVNLKKPYHITRTFVKLLKNFRFGWLNLEIFAKFVSSIIMKEFTVTLKN